MDNKQKLIIGAVVFILFIGIGASWLFWWGKGSATEPEAEQAGEKQSKEVKPALTEDQIPVIDLEVNPDRSGGVLKISSIDSDFSQLEYELIYTAESEGLEIERGVAGGPISVPESGTISEKILFGTESCSTGVCHRRIDKNVSRGKVIIRLFNDQDQSWSVEKEFTIEEAASGGYKAVFTE